MTQHPGADSRPHPGAVAAEAADVVKAAVLRVAGVAGLHGGPFGEAATYLPGRSVQGVQLRPGKTIVHIVLAWGVPLHETADAVRAAVAGITRTPVDVVVEDVETPLATAVFRSS